LGVADEVVTVNDEVPTSPPATPVTVTPYTPFEIAPTINDPVNVPAVTEQGTAPVARVVGAKVQPVSVVKNPDPATLTVVPGGPEVGVNVTVGPTTWKLA